jgi:dihydrofolate reductase
MRKLKLQVQITIDGFIAGPKGEMDWMEFNWSDDIKEFVTQITAPVDLILLGKNLAQGFIPHWAAVATDPGSPEFTAGRKFTETKKVVFTKTLDKSEWSNTILAKGNLVEEVMLLKNQTGGDIIAYGGGKFVSSLIGEKLIDELNLFVNPVVIGKGMSIFHEVTAMQSYMVVSVKNFQCGITALTYKLK